MIAIYLHFFKEFSHFQSVVFLLYFLRAALVRIFTYQFGELFLLFQLHSFFIFIFVNIYFYSHCILFVHYLFNTFCVLFMTTRGIDTYFPTLQ